MAHVGQEGERLRVKQSNLSQEFLSQQTESGQAGLPIASTRVQDWSKQGERAQKPPPQAKKENKRKEKKRKS